MKKKVSFIVILCVAVFFRVYLLDSIPPGPTADEASIGYNAYSILHTGKDEYGTVLPLLLRAYDDWRPALYVYVVIPFIKMFGLNVFALRFPSVILSVISVIITYFLTKELLTRIKGNHDNRFIGIPEAAMALVAVSPWHIYISRLGHEVNLALASLICGIYFIIRYVNAIAKKPLSLRDSWSLYLGIILLGISFDSYQSTKIVVPLLCVVLLGTFYREFVKNKIALLLAVVIGFIVVFPILISLFSPQALVRFQGTSIFSSRQDLIEKSATRGLQNDSLLSRFYDNRRFVYPGVLTEAYISHLNPSWLYTNLNNGEFKAPDFGLFYLFEIILFFFAVVGIYRWPIIDKRYTLLLFLWIFIGILPAAISTGYPHGMRIFNILPAPFIIEAFGLFYLLSIFRNRIYKRALIIIGIGIFMFFVGWFYHSYFYNLKRELSSQFQYGVIPALEFVKSYKNTHTAVAVSNKDRLFESYMFYLFSNKENPSEYQKKGGTKSGGFEAEHTINDYYFLRPQSLKTEDKATLFITNPHEIDGEEKRLIHTVKYPNGEDALWVLESSTL